MSIPAIKLSNPSSSTIPHQMPKADEDHTGKVDAPFAESDQGNASPFSSLKEGLQYFAAGNIFGIINTTAVLAPIMQTGLDFCPELPGSIYSYARSNCHLRSLVPSFGGTLGAMAVHAPITEELFFRVGMQELLLKQLPKAILRKLAPSHVGLVDSRAAKVFRVTLTALAFSLVHAMPPTTRWPNCSAVRLVNTFVIGLLLGGIQEVTGSPLKAMAFHAGNNAPIAYLFHNMGMQLSCPPEYVKPVVSSITCTDLALRAKDDVFSTCRLVPSLLKDTRFIQWLVNSTS